MTLAEKKAQRTANGRAEPTWEIARLFPYQGEWTEEEYLALDTNHLIEFDHGYLEVLPMPDIGHQRIVAFLYRLLWNYVSAHDLGEVLFAPMPVQLRTKKYREPDILFVRAVRRQTSGSFVAPPDLVMEVVSPDDPDRDYVKKRAEYAQARIPEYWIVDPLQQRITVLVLAGEGYAESGEYGPAMRAASKLLEGFHVDVDEVFAAAG
jgi:Uma2 family endonuclease